jgi:4-alpha-glucanotransferase
MIALRKNIDALRTGEFIPIYTDVDVYGYARRIKDGKDVFGNKRNNGFVIVLINRSQYDAHTVNLDLERWGVNQLESIFDNNVEFVPFNGRIEVDILPLSSRVLKMTIPNIGDGSVEGTDLPPKVFRPVDKQI